jgi:nucleoside-diphosphate-sugar epimerase
MLVTGADGFIGWHMVRFLKKKGFWVRGVDIKEPDLAPSDADACYFPRFAGNMIVIENLNNRGH